MQTLTKATHLPTFPAHEGLSIGASCREFHANALQMHRIGHGQTLQGDPVTQQITLARDIECLQSRDLYHAILDHLRRIDLGQGLQQVTRLTEMCGTARRGFRRRGPTRLQQRDDAMPKVIAIETLIEIAVILDPSCTSRLQPLR